MSGLTRQVAVACAIFFVLTYLLGGLAFDQGFGQEALISAGFTTLIFAMIYAAVRVGMLVFSSRD